MEVCCMLRQGVLPWNWCAVEHWLWQVLGGEVEILLVTTMNSAFLFRPFASNCRNEKIGSFIKVRKRPNSLQQVTFKALQKQKASSRLNNLHGHITLAWSLPKLATTRLVAHWQVGSGVALGNDVQYLGLSGAVDQMPRGESFETYKDAMLQCMHIGCTNMWYTVYIYIYICIHAVATGVWKTHLFRLWQPGAGINPLHATVHSLCLLFFSIIDGHAELSINTSEFIWEYVAHDGSPTPGSCKRLLGELGLIASVDMLFWTFCLLVTWLNLCLTAGNLVYGKRLRCRNFEKMLHGRLSLTDFTKGWAAMALTGSDQANRYDSWPA